MYTSVFSILPDSDVSECGFAREFDFLHHRRYAVQVGDNFAGGAPDSTSMFLFKKEKQKTKLLVGIQNLKQTQIYNCGMRNFETNMFSARTASSILVRSLATWSAFGCRRNVIAIFLFSEWLIYGIV